MECSAVNLQPFCVFDVSQIVCVSPHNLKLQASWCANLLGVLNLGVGVYKKPANYIKVCNPSPTPNTRVGG